MLRSSPSELFRRGIPQRVVKMKEVGTARKTDDQRFETAVASIYSHSEVANTGPFHGSGAGSNPAGSTIFHINDVSPDLEICRQSDRKRKVAS